MGAYGIVTRHEVFRKVEGYPLTGHGGLYGCEMFGIPHFLDSRFTDDNEVSLTHRPASAPQKSFLLVLVLNFVRCSVNRRA
jgi:hypothetical protein